jgi:hypothetical protein
MQALSTHPIDINGFIVGIPQTMTLNALNASTQPDSGGLSGSPVDA